jgi:hypothetical protein
MNQRIEILNELRSISPLLAGIGNANVFAVPGNYFEFVSDTVMACLHEENRLLNIDGTGKDDVPEGYFNGLADAIIAKIKGEKDMPAEELKEISALLSGIKKANVFEVPAQYFDQVTADILLQTDSEQISSVPDDVKKLQPFEVPEGYFTGFPAAVLSRVSTKAETRVVNISKRSMFIKYAAAAIITGALALGVARYINKPVVENNAILETAQLDPVIEKGKNMDDKKFNETLNNLSEEDIAQYLEKNGSDADIAVLISNVEENSFAQPGRLPAG